MALRSTVDGSLDPWRFTSRMLVDGVRRMEQHEKMYVDAILRVAGAKDLVDRKDLGCCAKGDGTVHKKAVESAGYEDNATQRNARQPG